jgi:simple sugar transport system ATP-binding protein
MSDVTARPSVDPGTKEPTGTPVFEAIDISKHFGPTTALVGVSLTARAGRIVALLGDNGAGKSTLIKILSGVFPPDRGVLRFRGEPVRFRDPNDARARGIATCYQDLAVCELLSVTRNVVLGREPQRGVGPFRFFDVATADRMTREALAKLGVRFERALDERGANLSGGERQSLAIARAMFFGSTCLILDEPTSALAVRQASTVLEHIALARDAGAAVILITHNFRHALSVADDIVVLAQGRVAGTFLRNETDLEQLTELVANVG